mgnify:FL=1|jgi:hypothetical protein
MTLDLDNLTAEDQKRWDTYSMISDTFKSINGCRTRFDWSVWTQEELDTYLNELVAQSIEQQKEEEVWEKQKESELEKNIQSVIASGAGDRETAIRWMWDAFLAEKEYPDLDYWFYQLQIPYRGDLSKELTAIVQKLAA